jgi:YVTN family beta-propeller protein
MKSRLVSQAIGMYTLALLMASAGCTVDDNDEDTPSGYSQGVFILNEGPFSSGTGTVSFYSLLTGNVVQDVFRKANNRPLGNIAQSLTIFKDRIFIAVNNAGRVEVVSLSDFTSIKTIEGLSLPASVLVVDSTKAYVSCWDAGVVVISLDDYAVIGQVVTGNGPEKMLLHGDKVFVCNQGGMGIDSTVTVISTSTDQVTATLQVYPKPTGICLDKNDKLWVLCSGRGWNGISYPDDSEGHLVCINPDNLQIEKDVAFGSTSEHPEKLVVNAAGDELFYLFPGGICRFHVDSASIANTPFIAHAAAFYAVGYDPAEQLLYATDPLNFQQDGWVIRYDAILATPVDSFQAGIIPRDFGFVE